MNIEQIGPMFVTLHNLNDGLPIRVNLARCNYYESCEEEVKPDGARLFFSDRDYINVRETPDEIDAMFAPPMIVWPDKG